MEEIPIEKAAYIIAYFDKLLTPPEKQALRHHISTIKTEGVNNESKIKVYYKTGRLSDDPEILKYLENGYDQFIINCSKRILQENPNDVSFNLCPVCKKLARTPDAKQCRFCGHDWH